MDRSPLEVYVPVWYGSLSARQSSGVSVGIGGPCPDNPNAYYREYQYNVFVPAGVDSTIFSTDLDRNLPTRPVNYLVEYTTTITKQTAPIGSVTRTDVSRFNIPIGGSGGGTQLGRTSQTSNGTDPGATLSIQLNQVNGAARISLRFACPNACWVSGFVTVSGVR